MNMGFSQQAMCPFLPITDDGDDSPWKPNDTPVADGQRAHALLK
jgi:hypothetical protein